MRTMVFMHLEMETLQLVCVCLLSVEIILFISQVTQYQYLPKTLSLKH